MNIAIIGGGIVGLSTAYFLNSAGHNVTVIDPLPGEGCSFGNGGMIAHDHIHPVITKGLIKKLPQLTRGSNRTLWLPITHMHRSLPWLHQAWSRTGQSNQKTIQAGLTYLATHAVHAWREILDAVTDQSLVKQVGRYYVYESEQSFSADRSIWLDRANNGVDFYEVPIAEALPKLRGVFEFKHVMHVVDNLYVPQPRLFTQAFESSLRERGVSFIKDSVKTLEACSLGLRLFFNKGCKADSRFFDKAVIAAGAKSREILEELGVKVPLIAERGYSIDVSLAQPLVDKHVLLKDRHVSLSPTQEGVRITGLVELDNSDKLPKSQLYSHMAMQLQSILGHSNYKINYEWMGARPSTPDSLPIIDCLLDGKLLLGFGHQHIGMTLGPITAKLISLLAEGIRPKCVTDFFNIHRFGVVV
ncbi:FAD-binding oxidoreductase [Pseudomonas alliivorans]|nr:FAD-binding oxidoreductase [Pseudomonas alliivorans]